MQEWEWDQKEDKLALLLRIVANKQYDDSIGGCAVELARKIRESLKEED